MLQGSRRVRAGHGATAMAGVNGLDVSAAVSKVKRDKQSARKAEKAKAKAKPRNTSAAFVRGVASAAAAGANAAPRPAPAAAAARAAQKPPRQMPLQQRVKRAFDHLRAHRGPQTAESVAAALGGAVAGDLLQALREHSHVTVDAAGGTLAYRPTHALASRDDLAALLRRHPFGVLSSELADAYAGGRDDIAALVADGAAFEVDSAEKPSSVVFPNSVSAAACPPDEAAAEALLAVEVPQSDAARDAALAAAGIARAKRSTARLRMAVIEVNKAAGRKGRKERAIRNATNTHLQHLFAEGGAAAGAGPIDGA